MTFFSGIHLLKKWVLCSCTTAPSVASDCIPSDAINTALLKGGRRPADSRRDEGLVPTFK